LVDDRFSGLKHFWSAVVVDRPKTRKKLNENIEMYEPEGDFADEEKIEYLVNLTGVFPFALVMDDYIEEQLADHCVPPLGDWDHDLGVAWFIPREVVEKKTRKGRTYWLVKVVDSTSKNTTIKCWAVDPKKDVVHLNRPYMARLDYSEDWGFSTRSVRYNFKLLG
jgi:hypothetical protein